MFNITDYQKTVLHESGHAVVYHILGRRLKKIYAKENGEGFVKPVDDRGIHFPYGLSDLLLTEMTELALICFSGYVAEAQCLFQTFKSEDAYKMGGPVNGIYSNNDFGNLRSKMYFANKVAGEEYFDYSFFVDMHDLTKRLMKNGIVRSALSKVAEGLFNSPHSTLTGEQVHSLCSEFITLGEGVDKFINPALSA